MQPGSGRVEVVKVAQPGIAAIFGHGAEQFVLGFVVSNHHRHMVFGSDTGLLHMQGEFGDVDRGFVDLGITKIDQEFIAVLLVAFGKCFQSELRNERDVDHAFDDGDDCVSRIVVMDYVTHGQMTRDYLIQMVLTLTNSCMP